MARGSKPRHRATAPARTKNDYMAFVRSHLCVHLIEDERALEELNARLLTQARERGALEIALDFETVVADRRSLDVLRTVQIGCECDRPRQYLIDCRAINAESLRELFAEPALPKIVQGARFEQRWAVERFGTPLASVYDTCEAMRVIQRHLAEMEVEKRRGALARLGLDWTPNIKAGKKETFFFGNDLGSLCRRLLGLPLPKENQRSDWGAEHLRADQICYMAMDVAVSFPLAQETRRIAAGLGLADEVSMRTERALEHVAENAETRLRACSRDESVRLERSLRAAGSSEELERLWALGRSLALNTYGYARLKRLYESRRTGLRTAA